MIYNISRTCVAEHLRGVATKRDSTEVATCATAHIHIVGRIAYDQGILGFDVVAFEGQECDIGCRLGVNHIVGTYDTVEVLCYVESCGQSLKHAGDIVRCDKQSHTSLLECVESLGYAIEQLDERLALGLVDVVELLNHLLDGLVVDGRVVGKATECLRQCQAEIALYHHRIELISVHLEHLLRCVEYGWDGTSNRAIEVEHYNFII